MMDTDAIRADLAEIESYETASLLNAPAAAMRVLRAVPAMLDALDAERDRITLDYYVIRRAIADPGQFVKRGDNGCESIPSWGAQAVIAALTAQVSA